MRLKALLATLPVTLLAACATVEEFPDKRPMSQENIAKINETSIAIVENHDGVAKTWYYHSSANNPAVTSQGLVGALAGAIADAIINAVPMARANRLSNDVAAAVPADGLSKDLLAAFEAGQSALVAAAPAPESAEAAVDTPVAQGSIKFAQMKIVPRIARKVPLNDQVMVDVSYFLSEDATTMRAVSSVQYSNTDLAYKTPYSFKKSAPKSELSGPVYRNVFTYDSTAFSLPVLDDDMKKRLVDSVNEAYIAKHGKIPTEGSQLKKYNEEVAEANDKDLSKHEASIFLVRNWVKDDGKVLRDEIAAANAFFAKYIALDINSASVPGMNGTDEFMEKSETRVVRKIGAGRAAGSYVSSSSFGTTFTTFGNTTSVADVNSARAASLREAGKAKAKPAANEKPAKK